MIHVNVKIILMKSLLFLLVHLDFYVHLFVLVPMSKENMILLNVNVGSIMNME